MSLATLARTALYKTRPNLLTQRILRRHNSSAPKSNQPTSPPKSHSIPGPSWAWIEPLAAPFRAYGRMQARSPYMTQLSSSLVIYFLGDLSAQMVANTMRRETTASDHSGGSKQERREERQRQDYLYAPERGLRAMVIGGISAIPSYHWFLFLGRRFNYSSHALSIMVKIVVNQSVFTPIFNTYFFGMHSLLSANGLAETKRRILEAVPVSWKNSWKVWPIVTAFSFTFVAPQYRSVTAGVVAIGWQTYLSWLNSRTARGPVGPGTIEKKTEPNKKKKRKEAKKGSNSKEREKY